MDISLTVSCLVRSILQRCRKDEFIHTLYFVRLFSSTVLVSFALLLSRYLEASVLNIGYTPF